MVVVPTSPYRDIAKSLFSGMDAVVFIGKFGRRNKSHTFHLSDRRHSSKKHLTILI